MFSARWQLLLLLAVVVAVTAMGVRLLSQDLALEHQETRQRLDAELATAAATTDRALLQTAAALRDPAWRPPPGAVLVRAANGAIETHPPRALLFAPIPPPPAAPAFAAAETEEFVRNNLDLAAALYRQAATPPALVRLARVQRKQGLTSQALATYSQLLTAPGYFEQTPIALLAALARAELKPGAVTELTEFLDNPPIPPLKDVYLFHAQRAAELTGNRWRPDPAKLALAEAVHALWPDKDGDARAAAGGITVLSHRDPAGLTLLAAPLSFAQTHWAPNPRIRIAQSGTLTRLPSATGLPWPIALPADPAPTLFSGRRRPLAAGTFTVPLLILLTGYLSLRAVHRERAAAAMQADFVAAVSHEFRTPLTALRQFNGLLLERDTLTDAQRRACYEAQARSTERLSRLVESLLDFRRMEAGARPYHPEPVDAAGLLARLTADFQRESNAEVHLDAPACHTIQADPAALSLALWNLLDNAHKYGRAPIEVTLAASPAQTRITVKDHGPGIPAAERHRIFDKFYRGAGARQDGSKGTGIGLAMVRHIAEAHRGRIEVESQPGQGTAFTLTLPN